MLNIHNWKFQNESFIFLNRKFISLHHSWNRVTLPFTSTRLAWSFTTHKTPRMRTGSYASLLRSVTLGFAFTQKSTLLYIIVIIERNYPHPLATHPRTDRLVSLYSIYTLSETRRFENIHHTMQGFACGENGVSMNRNGEAQRSVNLARLQKERYIGERFTFSNCRKQKSRRARPRRLHN